MTERNSLKRRVRARMEKTGESYTTARAAVRAAAAPAGEFERQVERLVERGYPALAGIGADELRARLAPLAAPAARLEAEPVGDGRFQFVIVPGRELVDPERAAELVEREGRRAALTMLEAGELERWLPIEGVEPPGGDAYLVADVDTGAESLGVTPNDALGTIAAAGRSPLTVDEGIALLTHHPEALAKNACFYTLGSRCGDKRVTALWLSKGLPKLGWCWAGNPHTWLGSASCGARAGA
jgi:hypothetical protein